VPRLFAIALLSGGIGYAGLKAIFDPNGLPSEARFFKILGVGLLMIGIVGLSFAAETISHKLRK
jgi:hypothetical protein